MMRPLLSCITSRWSRRRLGTLSAAAQRGRSVVSRENGSIMKLVLLVGLLSVGMVHSAQAQSLDIGGIELRLGQKVDEALRSLSSYQVKYSSGSWVVTQKVGELHQVLGTISARDNAITFIGKVFNWSANAGDATEYTRASEEVHRRGGMTCVTREVEWTDGLIHAFETQCGLFKLSYFLPDRFNGELSRAGVNISIKKQ